MNLENHYAKLLGIGDPWSINQIKLNTDERYLEIGFDYHEDKARCPICHAHARFYDKSCEQTWRHLDILQYTTLLRGKIPRIICDNHGLQKLSTPWHEPKMRQIFI